MALAQTRIFTTLHGTSKKLSEPQHNVCCFLDVSRFSRSIHFKLRRAKNIRPETAMSVDKLKMRSDDEMNQQRLRVQHRDLRDQIHRTTAWPA